MKTTTIKWHNVATDGLPEKSGWYLVLTEAKCFMNLQYSAEYQLFNADVNKNHVINVIYWAELPKIDEE